MRHFLVGTDWWTDCDDAVALRVMARAIHKGEIAVQGIGINACMEQSVSSLTAFLRSEGLLDIPLGLDREAVDFGGSPPCQARLAALGGAGISNDDAEDAAALYLRLLRETTVPLEIVEIGYPQVLAAVLREEPRLFAERVSRVWMMAGKWDEDPGRENNFARNARSRTAAHYFCANCPVPVTFLGWEVSYDILIGGHLKEGDILHQVLADHHSENGRSGWDPMLMELAVVGDAEKAGYRSVKGKASVDPVTGENTFVQSPDGLQEYVEKELPDAVYRERLNALIASV